MRLCRILTINGDYFFVKETLIFCVGNADGTGTEMGSEHLYIVPVFSVF